ncbi:biotin/lipoate A/B protein ligase family protein [Pontiellaceae bacterium B12227]|nr:biotin/lipoate A/B protein ligase family protein [Pontiellaceae bacterium B12227]
MLIFESESLDVYRNLAIEEYLMDHVGDCGPILFLWQSECAVVMGKNQNPWKECRLDRMAQEDVPLARRISGGGTVYHDAGNLNYCVITSREAYKEEMAYELVFQALETFGIRAEKTGKSNLSVDGLKFSGNAFAFRKGKAMHHGTLLLETDLKRLSRYLGSMVDGIETHAIASVPASVTNLGVDKAELVEALCLKFQIIYGDGDLLRRNEADLDVDFLKKVYEKQLSNEWKYGSTPRFLVNVDGEMLEIVKGFVKNGAFKRKAFKDLAFSLFC